MSGLCTLQSSERDRRSHVLFTLAFNPALSAGYSSSPLPPPRETGRKLRGLSHTANVWVTWIFLVPKPTGANPTCRGVQSAVVNQPLSCPELFGLQNRGAVEHWGVGRHTHTKKVRGALESDTCKIGSGSGKGPAPAPGQQSLVAMEIQKDQ